MLRGRPSTAVTSDEESDGASGAESSAESGAASDGGSAEESDDGKAEDEQDEQDEDESEDSADEAQKESGICGDDLNLPPFPHRGKNTQLWKQEKRRPPFTLTLTFTFYLDLGSQ